MSPEPAPVGATEAVPVVPPVTVPVPVLLDVVSSNVDVSPLRIETLPKSPSVAELGVTTMLWVPDVGLPNRQISTRSEPTESALCATLVQPEVDPFHETELIVGVPLPFQKPQTTYIAVAPDATVWFQVRDDWDWNPPVEAVASTVAMLS